MRQRLWNAKNCIDILRKDVEKYWDQAENDNKMTLLTKANSVRKTVKVIKNLISELENPEKEKSSI